MILLSGLLIIRGLRTVHRTALGRITAWLLVPYLIVVVGHPYPMIRYLVPLVPLTAILAAAGVDRLWLRGSVRPRINTVDWRIFPSLMACVAMAIWLGANLIGISHFPEVTQRAIHGGFGRPMALDWRGFEQTFAWVRQHTRPESRLATPYGALYFAFTDRRAVRPWFHEPDLYEPDYGIGSYSCQDVGAIHDDLRRLSIDYVIADPMLLDLDSAYGANCISELLRQYRAEFTLVFTSVAGEHRVYRRQDPAQ
jgi:hypothetical protein